MAASAAYKTFLLTCRGVAANAGKKGKPMRLLLLLAALSGCSGVTITLTDAILCEPLSCFRLTKGN